MRSVNDVEINEGDLLTAEQMRQITSTQEELFEKKRIDIKVNFMETMVRLAREQGRTFYGATFRKESDTSLMDQIKQDFEELGYAVQSQDSVQEIQGNKIPVTVVTVSWEQQKEDQDVSSRSEDK